MDFEVCIDSVSGAKLAEKYGAKRVELCSALSEGGLTPSPGMIEACVQATVNTAVYVMIRPRAGYFKYSLDEINIMLRDIEAAKTLGADGVVFGCLDQHHQIDITANMTLLEKAFEQKLGTTFHRAIDLTPNLVEALEHLIHLGFDRVLSSGGQKKAIDGLKTLSDMKKQAKQEIEIMAGSGINESSVQDFIQEKLDAIHFTTHQVEPSSLKLDMGSQYLPDENKIQKIQAILQAHKI